MRSTQKTVVPNGYTGKSFNTWQIHLQKQLDKIKKTSVSAKLR